MTTKSSKKTLKSDMISSSTMPNVLQLTLYTFRTIVKYWRGLAVFALLYSMVYILIAGLIDQSSYMVIRENAHDIVKTYMGSENMLAESLVLATTLTIGANTIPNDVISQSQILVAAILVWLMVSWYLRAMFDGFTVTIRDAVYSSGAPLVASFVVVVTGLLQILPLSVAILLYSVAESIHILTNGWLSLTAIIIVVAITALSIYWLTSTVIAVVIVSVPRTYPGYALKLASQLVRGRRLLVAAYYGWLVIATAIGWLAVMMVTTYIAGAWRLLDNIAIIPVISQMMIAFTLIFSSVYTLLFYRNFVSSSPTKGA